MARRALAAAVLAIAGAGSSTAQTFPGEAPRPPSFPTTLAVFVTAGWSGDRAIRTYDVGQPNPADPACDSLKCQTTLGAGSAIGVGGRVQLPISRIAGLRAGLAVSWPPPRIATLDGSQVRTGTARVTLLRGDLMLLFRFKPQAPVFFGVGAALARFNPGLAPDQDQSTDVGGVAAVGYDHRIKPSLGVRFEWTAYYLIPGTADWPAEYDPESAAFDHQFSVGLSYFIKAAPQ
ncbi:MAG TPA: hypothetical protein VD707_05175 [Gemmatimonadales bacterium]|nr:hypothetical protein [Gemmatimonadales bacterium]